MLICKVLKAAGVKSQMYTTVYEWLNENTQIKHIKFVVKVSMSAFTLIAFCC